MRRRMINPDIWDDPAFTSLSIEERLLFIGLITIADDEGRLRGNAAYLKKMIFAYDNITVKEVEIHRNKLIDKIKNVVLYKDNDDELIQLLQWEKHQTLRKDRIKKSEFPPIKKDSVIDVKVEKKTDEQFVEKQKTEIIEDVDLNLAKLMFEEIKKNLPEFKEPNFSTWAKDIGKIRRIDKRSEKQIEYLIKWCQQSDFWQANILSPNKLRKQFDRLVAEVQREKKQKEKPTNNEIKLHDGMVAVKRFGKWVSAKDNSIAIDLSYYPELRELDKK